jgi:hypothetical protein
VVAAPAHGSMFHRAPGSIGASAFPSRVMKGMRMGGRMGGDQVTVKNLRVTKIDPENNLIYIRVPSRVVATQSSFSGSRRTESGVSAMPTIDVKDLTIRRSARSSCRRTSSAIRTRST